MLYDEEMMLLAIEEAKKAGAMGEVPIGAVIIDGNGEIIGRGYNTRETEQRPTGHAELIAIEEAAKHKNNWRLSDCTLYVTLEPCPMCAGAIMNARLKRIVYGAFDENGGALSSVISLYEHNFGYKPFVRSRILERECALLLTDFFKNLRKAD